MWSFSLGRILDIEIRIHYLFVFFAALLGMSNALHSGVEAAFGAVFWLVMIFAFVLLHELGHCMVAKHYGLVVKNITLWPLGGLVSMENIPRNPVVEIQIALAGPLVNLVLALFLSPIALIGFIMFKSTLFVTLVAANLVLMIFNLLPAFPMDGGRVYRAWQAMRLDYYKATERAVRLGTILAIFLGVLGLFFEPSLIAIAFFIVLAGRQELAACYYQNNFVDMEEFFRGQSSQNDKQSEDMSPEQFMRDMMNKFMNQYRK